MVFTRLCSIWRQHPTDQSKRLVTQHAVAQIQTDQRGVGGKGRVQGQQTGVQQWATVKTAERGTYNLSEFSKPGLATNDMQLYSQQGLQGAVGSQGIGQEARAADAGDYA